MLKNNFIKRYETCLLFLIDNYLISKLSELNFKKIIEVLMPSIKY